MRLLSALCLVGAVTMVTSIATPGAPQRSNPMLHSMQLMLANASYSLWPDGESWESGINMAIMMASQDLCKIKNRRQQSDDSIIMGQKCKDEFSKLYNQNQCSGGICDMIAWIRDDSLGFVSSIITARTMDDVFRLIEEDLYVPMMEWACECSNDMMDSWMDCRDGIGEAKIWNLLRMSDAFEMEAPYLGDRTFKDFWTNVIVNEIPWDSISTFVERMMANLCQDSGKNKEQCYDYFYDTMIKLYQWYMNSMSRKETPARFDGYPGHCSKFDLSVLDGEMSFMSIKSALTNKFCVEECSGLYQDVLLGCCTASMIKDTALEDALVDIAEEFVEKLAPLFVSEDEDEGGLNIDAIFSYAEDTLEMLRNPTCERTSVTYDLTACGDESSSGGGGGGGGSCASLKSQMMVLKKQMEMKCSGGGGGGDDPCAGLSGKKKFMCKKEQAGGGGGDNGGRGGGGRGGGGGGGRGGGGGGRGGGGGGGGRGGGGGGGRGGGGGKNRGGNA